MANSGSITTSNGDKVLQLNAKRVVRRFDNLGSAVDVRVGFASKFVGTGQGFSSTTSVYETFRFCFAAGTGVVPGVTGEFIGIGNAVGVDASITFAGFDGLSNAYNVNNVSRLYNLTTHVPTSTQLTTDDASLVLHGDSVYLKEWVFRLVKSSTNIILFESYVSGNQLPYSDSTMNNTLTSLSGLTRRHSYTFASTEARDAIFNSMDTAFLAWPWYNANAQVAAMAYRVI